MPRLESKFIAPMCYLKSHVLWMFAVPIYFTNICADRKAVMLTVANLGAHSQIESCCGILGATASVTLSKPMSSEPRFRHSRLTKP
jgi:hypothetical protein